MFNLTELNFPDYELFERRRRRKPKIGHPRFEFHVELHRQPSTIYFSQSRARFDARMKPADSVPSRLDFLLEVSHSRNWHSQKICSPFEEVESVAQKSAEFLSNLIFHLVVAAKKAFLANWKRCEQQLTQLSWMLKVLFGEEVEGSKKELKWRSGEWIFHLIKARRPVGSYGGKFASCVMSRSWKSSKLDEIPRKAHRKLKKLGDYIVTSFTIPPGQCQSSSHSFRHQSRCHQSFTLRDCFHDVPPQMLSTPERKHHAANPRWAVSWKATNH